MASMDNIQTMSQNQFEDWKGLKLREPTSAEQLSRRDESQLSRLGKKRTRTIHGTLITILLLTELQKS